MWVVTNKGFMSIVAKDENGRPSGSGPEAIVSVRFRRKRDATALFPGYAVTTTPKGDYGFRVFATRTEVARVLVHEALGIDYANFKSSIPDHDEALHDACMEAWAVFGRAPTTSRLAARPAGNAAGLCSTGESHLKFRASLSG